jgi:hypothetical protein
VARNAPAGIAKLVWLTAKKRTYAALSGEYVPIHHTHFNDLETLLRALLSELGVPADHVPEDASREVLIEETLEVVNEFPCFLVVDDIDSLDGEAQFDVFRTISMIFDRVIANGHQRARALLTARLNLGAAPGQLMIVEGLPFDEFTKYVNVCLQALRLGGATFNVSQQLNRLHRASSGSPLFAASVLRLVSLGESLSSAINQWKGAEGEEVRRFAFERELESLTDSQIRTLFAAQILGRTTFMELLDVLQGNRTVLRDDIGVLRNYHLISLGSGTDLTRAGLMLEIPDVIPVMSDLIRSRVRDPARVEKACARLRRNTENPDTEAARYIHQVVSFWSAGGHDSALETAMVATKRQRKSADLRCLLGRAHMAMPSPDLVKADVALRTAREMGCTRPELFPLWLDVKERRQDWIGLIDVACDADKEYPSPDNIFLSARAHLALGEQLEGNGNWSGAAEQYRRGAIDIHQAFEAQRARGRVVALKDLKHALALNHVRAVDNSVRDPQQKIEVWAAVVDAYRIKEISREICILGIRRLTEWWAAVQFRPEPERTTANKLRSELAELHRLASELRQKGGSWERVADLLHQVGRELSDKLRRYEVELTRITKEAARKL